jgi:hypothetical protein
LVTDTNEGEHDDVCNGEKGADCPDGAQRGQVDPPTQDELRQFDYVLLPGLDGATD